MPADILFVTHRVPFPPDKGDRVRTYHLLRFLTRHARVHLATLADERVAPETLATLQKMCHRVEIVPLTGTRWLSGLRSAALGGTISAGMFHAKALRGVIENWTKETRFDAAIASASSVANYLNVPSLIRANRIVDLVDVDSQKWRDYADAIGGPKSWIYGLESRRVRRLEKAICGWANSVVLVSDREAADMQDISGTDNIFSIPNGVDLEYFRGVPNGRETGCVFVGALDYFPNIDGIRWFAQTVWPNVRVQRPDARLSIVGRKPTRVVQDLTQIPGVDVVGEVPDVRPYLERAAVAIAPLRLARGVQNKVLEALAAGKPVVASPAALAGFDPNNGVPAICANDAGDWIHILARLLADDGERKRLAFAGHEYVDRYHDWSDCLSPIVHLLRTPRGIPVGEPV